MLVCVAKTFQIWFDWIIWIATRSTLPIIFSFDSVFSSNKLQTEWKFLHKAQNEALSSPCPTLNESMTTTMMILRSEEPRAFLAIRIPDFAEKAHFRYGCDGGGFSSAQWNPYSPLLPAEQFPGATIQWHLPRFLKIYTTVQRRVAAHKSRKIRKRN